MNKAQKGAWFGLIMSPVLLAFLLVLIGTYQRFFVRFFSLVILSLMGIFIIFLGAKHSQAEVDFDERDKFISRRALLVSYSFLCGLLVAVSVISSLIFGHEGSVRVCFLPLIVYGLFLTFILTYSVVILVQYGRGGKKIKT